MPASTDSRKFVLAIALCAAAALCGCRGSQKTSALPKGAGPSQTSADEKLAEPSLEQQTEQKLDPLTKEDVELYLKVMRAAAQRDRNLTRSDRAALDRARQILAGSASGRVPTQADARTLEQANLVALAMDQIVAQEMKLDGRAYRGISEAIEAAVSNPAQGAAANAASGAGSAADSANARTPLEKRFIEVNTANERFLAPYREEVLKLIAIVRNPANLPK